MKKVKKAVTKKVGKLEKNAKAWEKARQRARDYVQEMQEQGFYIDTETAKLLNYKGPERMTKKRLDKLRKKVTKTQLKQRATWGIEVWEKVIYSTDLDTQGNPIKDKSGRTIVSSQVSTSVESGGLDVMVDSPFTYADIERVGKNPTKGDKKLAKQLNEMIEYQKHNFLTTEDLLANKIWELAILLNDSKIPQPGTNNEYFEVAPTFTETHYAKDPTTGHYITATWDTDIDKQHNGYETVSTEESYKIYSDPEMQEYMRFAFFRSVKFKTLPAIMQEIEYKADGSIKNPGKGEWINVIDKLKEIAQHPQTSEDLYKQFRESSSLRTFNAHYNKLVNELAKDNNLPPQVAGALLWVMLTSQVWNVAGREYLPSAQFTSNWRHIYYDLSQLEDINPDRKSEKAIDELLSDIMSETTDTADISKRVEQILQYHGKQYKSLGKIY